MQVKLRLSFPVRCDNPCAHYFVGVLHRSYYGIGWPFIRMAWPGDDIAFSDATDYCNKTNLYIVFFSELFQTGRDNVAVLQADHKNTPQGSFRCFHAVIYHSQRFQTLSLYIISR